MSEKVDVLNRKDFIDKLIQLVEGFADKKQGCCFGIDGAWGSGKTFVLEKFEEQLKDIQSEETAGDKYYVFHYDCWKYDYYEEPAIAIIAAMLDEIDRELSLFSKDVEDAGKVAVETVKTTLKKIASELCKNKIGIDLVEVASEILDKTDKEKVKDFDSLYGFKKALEETRKGMQEIAEDKTVVIVVDELDRCLPTYSIKVLERLHHIFNELENVVVIVSMDKSQLEHSIKAIYGEIDVDTYLRKFISFKVCIHNGHANKYSYKFESYISLFDNTNDHEIEVFFINLMDGMDMRTQERIFRKAEIIHRIISTGEKMDSSIMTFEILFLTVAFKTRSTNISWLLSINRVKHAEITRSLDGEYYDMLKKYESSARIGGRKYNGIPVIEDGLHGRTFYWLANAFNCYENGVCGPYYYGKSVEKEIVIVKKFMNFVNTIDVD